MADEEQRRQDSVTIVLTKLAESTSSSSIPLTSSRLLGYLISAQGRSKPPLWKFTDTRKLDAILRAFEKHWEHGALSLASDDLGISIVDAEVNHLSGEPSRKRRRKEVDEDADSAAGADDTSDVETEDKVSYRSLTKEQEEVYSILQRGTAKGKLLAEQFRSLHDTFEPLCPHITKRECSKTRSEGFNGPALPACEKIHFRPLIRPHTEVSLGHCSYLNTCYSEPSYAQSPSIPPLPSAMQKYPRPMGAANLPSGLGAGGRGKEKAPCRYIHFEVDYDGSERDGGQSSRAMQRSEQGGSSSRQVPKSRGVSRANIRTKPYRLEIGRGPTPILKSTLPAQWINCDVRSFDCSVLGKFNVIMADPPWDIHMSLPYGTMTDDEMRAMPMASLQDEGLLFLWVTGRAMEIGRDCMRAWGYTRVDEVVWVKVNQLQRLIRTGRTGHWLNHTKEHMLVGVKTITSSTGELIWPKWVNKGLDTDVIVSEVRETSRKPDEAYSLIERMCPGGRKLEIFGRKHNIRPGWLTLGNQLGPDQIYEEDLRERIYERYPERLAARPMQVS